MAKHRSIRGNRHGVMGTEGKHRGPRQIPRSQGIAMKPRGKSVSAHTRVRRMEKANPYV